MSGWMIQILLQIIGNLTGRSLSEALILALANPHYDDRLFIELPFCVHKLFWMSKQKQFVYTTCSELGIFMY